MKIIDEIKILHANEKKFLGYKLESKDEIHQAIEILFKPFLRGTFKSFWNSWNPLYHYYLSHIVYKRLRKKWGKRFALYLTFLGSGLFLHDLPVILLCLLISGYLLPFPITFVFSTIGLVTIILDNTSINYNRLNSWLRAIINITLLLLCFSIGIMIAITIIKVFGDNLQLWDGIVR